MLFRSVSQSRYRGGGGGSGVSYFDSTTVNAIFTTGSVAFRGEETSIDAPEDKGLDVFFYVSGSTNVSGPGGKKAVFGGDVVISGSSELTGDLLEISGALSTTKSASFYDSKVKIGYASPSTGLDVFFYVSGSTGGSSRTLFGGDVIVSGSVIPGTDNTQSLGSANNRWSNVYTGDLHLKNDRGDWTVIEEEDYLTLRNNKTGKRFKLLMELIDD